MNYYWYKEGIDMCSIVGPIVLGVMFVSYLALIIKLKGGH